MSIPALFHTSSLELKPSTTAANFTNVLDFVTQNQQQTQWCWAAVSASVSFYYLNTTTWTQCTLANNQLGQTTCCSNGGSAACNQPWYLDRALTATGNLNAMTQGSKSYAQVQAAIDGSAPLGVRIAWSSGGGHFVTLYGYTNPQVLYVADPWYGYSLVDASTFPASYFSGGTWTHSYTTKA